MPCCKLQLCDNIFNPNGTKYIYIDRQLDTQKLQHLIKQQLHSPSNITNNQ